MPSNVLERTRQRSDASRAADDPAMQADRHHSWMAFSTSAIQPVEGISTIDEKILAGAEVAAALQAAVIHIEGMGDHEVRATGDLCPIRQIVVVGVAVV